MSVDIPKPKCQPDLTCLHIIEVCLIIEQQYAKKRRDAKKWVDVIRNVILYLSALDSDEDSSMEFMRMIGCGAHSGARNKEESHGEI